MTIEVRMLKAITPPFFPLSLHIGYFIEVNDYNNDGKINGYKVTMEGEISYYEEMDSYGARGQKTDKGKYYLSSSFVTIHFDKIDDVTFEIKDFGNKLCIDGETAYVWFKDIEMRGF